MLKNELTLVKRKEVFTTSKIIADKLGVSHKKIITVIERIIEKNKDLGGRWETPKFMQKFIETEFEHGKTKLKYKGYLLNEPAFAKFVMNAGNFQKAYEIQSQFIEQFYIMKEALQNQSNNTWIEKREETKLIRKQETDVLDELFNYILEQNPESYYSKNKGMLFSNYTKMTNKYLQLIVDCKEGKPIRNISSIRDLGFIMIVDDRCKSCILDGMNRKLPYKEIFYYTKEEISKLVDSLNFKPLLGN